MLGVFDSDDMTVEFFRLTYDVITTARKVKKAGLNAYLVERSLAGASGQASARPLAYEAWLKGGIKMAQSKKGRPVRMNVKVREAVLQDIQRITEIHNQAIFDRESLLDITPHPLKERLAWFKNLSGSEAVIVAEASGHVVGFCALQPFSPEELYAHIGIPTIWIEKDFRGRGIGLQLSRKITAMARKKGYRKLMFFAYSFNREKLGYYKEIGYKEAGILERHAKIKGKYMDVLVMERFL